jgi:sugar phosphate isomerase/epimerase
METLSHPLDRRSLLRGAGAVALGIAGASAAPALARGSGGKPSGRQRIPREKISIQLYTLRELPGGLAATLEALAEIGYETVEHAGFGDLGSAAAFRQALKDAGLRASSGHQGVPQPYNEAAWAQQVADAATVGQRYIVNPASPITFFGGTIDSLRGLTTAAAYRAYAADLNRAGEVARSAGLRLGFHNHFWEWHALTDDTPLTGFDILIAETDPKLVHFELDLYWSWYAHRDPVGLLAQLGDRIRQFHVKDMKFVSGTPAWTDPGTGVIDFVRIFDAAGNPNRHEYIVERDDAGAAALTTAQIGFDFLDDIRF